MLFNVFDQYVAFIDETFLFSISDLMDRKCFVCIVDQGFIDRPGEWCT